MGQYFSNQDLPSEIVKFNTNVLGNSFNFYTDNGVFSKSKLDFGSRVLLENIPINGLKGDILDVGCGYGVISIIVSKLTGLSVDGVDVNKRALHLADMNKKENKVEKVNFFESNCYENVSKKYSCIITNPPIRAGKKIVYEIIMNARNYLNPGGELYLVIHKDQGAKSVVRDLEEYYEVTILNKIKGFFVIKCIFR